MKWFSVTMKRRKIIYYVKRNVYSLLAIQSEKSQAKVKDTCRKKEKKSVIRIFSEQSSFGFYSLAHPHTPLKMLVDFLFLGMF